MTAEENALRQCEIIKQNVDVLLSSHKRIVVAAKAMLREYDQAIQLADISDDVVFDLSNALVEAEKLTVRSKEV